MVSTKLHISHRRHRSFRIWDVASNTALQMDTVHTEKGFWHQSYLGSGDKDGELDLSSYFFVASYFVTFSASAWLQQLDGSSQTLKVCGDAVSWLTTYGC